MYDRKSMQVLSNVSNATRDMLPVVSAITEKPHPPRSKQQQGGKFGTRDKDVLGAKRTVDVQVGSVVDRRL